MSGAEKTIFFEGTMPAARCLRSAAAGEVVVPSAEGKNAVVNLIGEGEIFGEIALADAGAQCGRAGIHDSTLMTIKRRDFLRCCARIRSHDQADRGSLRALRRTTVAGRGSDILDLEGRLVKTLLRLSKSANPAARSRYRRTN